MSRRVQSIITIFISAFAIFTLLISSSAMYIVNSGMEISKGRVGADVIVLSSDSNLNVSSFIYSGESTNKYIYTEDLDFIYNYDEIDKCTVEFFTHTLSAGCCSFGEKLRIVGIDQDTDFILKPWLEENDIQRLSDREGFIGDDVALPLGSKMAILGAPFSLVGSLYRTGTGMDRTIYIDIDVARKLAKKKMQPSIWNGKEPDELVTAMFIKLKDGIDAKKFVESVNLKQDKVKAYTKSHAIDDVKSMIKGWSNLAVILVLVVVLSAFISLYGRFSFVMNERKKEIGYLRAIGHSKSDIFKSIVYEGLIFSVISGLVSAVLTLAFMPKVIDFVAKQFYLPANVLGIKEMLIILIVSPLIVFILSFISVINPARKIIKLDPISAIQKGQK